MTYVPISCDDYDYIEIACMDRYAVLVDTNRGAIHGTALTTEVNNFGEFFIIQCDDGTRDSVRVDHIRKIVVLSQERRFDERIFATR